MTGERATIWWDFDGTLAYRDGLWSAALIAALDRVHAEHGLAVDDVALGLSTGFPWHSPEALHNELTDAADWWARLQPVFLAAYESARVDAEIAADAALLVREIFVDVSGWHLLAGARDAVEATAAEGVRNLIVSNHVPELPLIVEGLGISGCFTAMVNSAVVGAEKPHPLIFEAARRASVPDAPIWMVGDNPKADIEGAAMVGVPGILVGKNSELTALDAARRIITELG
ncbi:HAD family hydrolase [Gryllotalpicola ginsengisoli]|uniref:HAD family hydrolase n=1 Tax=Gryllotalpicola ginsengisoli TaxID=444608 RepID=UPI0003B633D6|nr:HAD-IA family hydrolase [Gryllotalpicola ginsengisoli]